MVIATIITVYNHGNSFRVSYFEKSSKQLIKQIEVKVAGDNTVNDSYFQAAIRALKDAEILNGNTMIIGMAYKVGVLQIKGEKEINKPKYFTHNVTSLIINFI